jgi:hypothetical protein
LQSFRRASSQEAREKAAEGFPATETASKRAGAFITVEILSAETGDTAEQNSFTIKTAVFDSERSPEHTK